MEAEQKDLDYLGRGDNITDGGCDSESLFDWARNNVVLAIVILIVLFLIVKHFVWPVATKTAERLIGEFNGTPVAVETPTGLGYVASPLPPQSGPNVRFNVFTSTDQTPYAAGYIDYY